MKQPFFFVSCESSWVKPAEQGRVALLVPGSTAGYPRRCPFTLRP